MRKLTKVQIKVLRRLAAGEVIQSRRFRTAGWMHNPWLYVHAGTVRSLAKRGLIGQRTAERPSDREWAISLKGKRTLEEHDAKIS